MNSEICYQEAIIKKRSDDLQYYKGFHYAFGYGVEEDLEKAKNAYMEGVKLKNAKCMYGLAVLLLKSNVNQEDELIYSLFYNAFSELYRQACSGDPVSQRMVSCYYLCGDRGVTKNLTEAKYWLLQAAENGDSEAQMNLAHCYETGNAFDIDIELSFKWYEKSAAQGNKEASQKLVELRRKYHG